MLRPRNAPEAAFLSATPGQIQELLKERASTPSLPGLLEKQSPTAALLFGLLLVGAIGVIQHWTQIQLSSLVFYLLPTVLGAWCGGMRTGVVLSLTSTLVCYAVDLHRKESQPIIYWDAGIGLGFFLLTSYLLARLRFQVLRERALARIDYLTGAANRLAFYEITRHEIERARRTQRPLTIAFMDLDNFKETNDCLGHLIGDELLCRFVEIVQQKTRASDALGRIGGDEFALLLPETDAVAANALLIKLHERLRQAMHEQGRPVTLSVGAVTFAKPPKDVDTLIHHADELLYDAKRNGKDRLCHVVIDDAPWGSDELVTSASRCRAV